MTIMIMVERERDHHFDESEAARSPSNAVVIQNRRSHLVGPSFEREGKDIHDSPHEDGSES